MGFIRFEGKRVNNVSLNRSINIFFASFVYPTDTGYFKRMDLLIRWADIRFSTVNFIIPKSADISNKIIIDHLQFCDNLFVIENKQHSFPIISSIQKIIYRLITGRYPKFDSSLFLNKTLIRNFKKVVNDFKTDYFLNTRSNFAGLIKFIPGGTISLIDTQDIYTDLYIKYCINGRTKWVQFFLLGYKENRHFVKSEIEVLNKYDKIIAISESDYLKYFSILLLRKKLLKIDSLGIEPKEFAVSTIIDKEFDCLFIASNFVGTQIGIKWFFDEVAPFLSIRISLCLVGAICDFVVSEKLNNINIDLRLQGFADDLDTFYHKSKIVTLSMPEATGTSVKGLEALAYGAAIVSTKSGVRFGGLENGFHCIITDNPKEFAFAIENLLIDQEKRSKLGDNSLKFAKENFSIKSTFKLLDRCF